MKTMMRITATETIGDALHVTGKVKITAHRFTQTYTAVIPVAATEQNCAAYRVGRNVTLRLTPERAKGGAA
jgi:hypothetical protein